MRSRFPFSSLIPVLLAGAAVLIGAGRLRAEAPLFAQFEAEPAVVYAGQPFTLKLSVFTTGQDIEPGMQISGLPDAIQLQPFEDMPAESKTVGGVAYQVLRNRCEAICAAPGELRFAPVIHGVATRTVQAFFFVQQYRNAIQIPIKPFVLQVKPIPLERAPKGYAGLIGSFELNGALSTNRVLPGDLVTLTYTLAGHGRFDKAPALSLPALPGFKIYPARLGPQQGGNARTYTQVIIPEQTNSMVIPPLSVVAFNPERDAFDVLTAGPYRLLPDSTRPTNAPVSIFMPMPGQEPPPSSAPLPIHPRIRTETDDPVARKQADAYFEVGNKAYAEGKTAEAIDAYAKILAMGIRASEVDANLGAACARAGHNGKAMLYLLRAIRLDPRDDLARRHLDLLLKGSAIPSAPDLGFWSRVRRREWNGLALFSILAILPWPVFRLRGRRAPAWTQTILILALAAVIPVSYGIAWWQTGSPAVECVVTTASVQGRIAPSDAAKPSARLIEGTVVRRLAEQDDWVRVWADRVAVWLPATSLDRP